MKKLGEKRRKFKLVRRSENSPFNLAYDFHLLGILIANCQPGINELKEKTQALDDLFNKVATTDGLATEGDIRKIQKRWKEFIGCQFTIEGLLEVSSRCMKILRH